jgi:hypothetical protein
MRSLNEELDLTLVRVHVVQSVEGADRAGVCGCPGAFAGTGKSNARSPWRARHLACESGASTQARDNRCTDRSRERLAHYLPPHVWTPPWRRPQKRSLIWPTKRRQPPAMTVAISSSFPRVKVRILAQDAQVDLAPRATSLLSHPSFEVKRAAAADEVQSETGHLRRATLPQRYRPVPPGLVLLSNQASYRARATLLPLFGLALNRRIVDDAKRRLRPC